MPLTSPDRFIPDRRPPDALSFPEAALVQAALPNPPDPPGVDDPRRDGGVGADAGTPYGRALREQLLGLPPLPTSSGSLGTAVVDGGASPAVPQRLTAGVEVAAGILGGAAWPPPPPPAAGAPLRIHARPRAAVPPRALRPASG